VIDDGPGGRGVYALRIGGRDERKDQLLRESLFLEELRRGLLNVPEPVLTRDGELHRSVSTPGVSGFRLVSLFRWVDGRPLPVGDWTVDIARAVGRMIGEIHLASEGFDWPEELAPAGGGGEGIPRLPVPPSSNRGDLEMLAESAIESTAGDRSARGVIHGDLTPEHILFSKAGVGTIGFSSCREGYYPYDLASVAAEIDEPLWEGLVSGYQEVRSFDPDRLSGFIALRRLELLARGEG
jgi:Ser/Thr protein kinase RdoA (MazF antagonist)